MTQTQIRRLTQTQIRRLRKRLGLSQAGLAEKLGLSRSAVYQWEAGNSSPTGAARILLGQLADSEKSENRG